MIYYWENPIGVLPDCGKLNADNDAEAIGKMPKTTEFMYRESDTDDGTPFITVYVADQE